MPRQARPDFLIVGAPKAGTSALHAALAGHPDIFMSRPKEAKYWLCDDAPPPHYGGPGDRHSQQEWIWRREEYDALFEPAADHQARGESTPFYLWSRTARERIAAELPDVRLVAVIRDPIDRAYSNWMHLWCDGLEPVADFERAFDLEHERIQRGYAPFWRYRELGLYGAQLTDLVARVGRERVLVLRYRELVDDPAGTLDRTCEFLGVRTGRLDTIPTDNARRYVEPGWRPTLLGPVVRAGAWAGQFARPELWRAVSPGIIRHLSGRAEAHRPRLTPEQRARLVPVFADDIAALSDLTGDDYSMWLSQEARGSFAERKRA
jgi:hypothetical protein